MSQNQEQENKFDPSRHLVKLRGGEYLETKWRLVWLRQEHPDAHILTEMVHFDPENKLAVFKATITVLDSGSATGYGSETAGDFKDYLEKAETKALGRALAALGFGTQHCQDFDYDNRGTHVVDNPAQRPAQSPYEPGVNNIRNMPQPAQAPALDSGSNMATAKQVAFIYAAGKEKGLSEDEIKAKCKEKFGVEPGKLTKARASQWIEMLSGKTAQQPA